MKREKKPMTRKVLSSFVLTTMIGLAAIWLLTSNEASKVQRTEASEWPTTYKIEDDSYGFFNPRPEKSELSSEITVSGVYPLLETHEDETGSIWVLIADQPNEQYVWFLVEPEPAKELSFELRTKAPLIVTPAEAEEVTVEVEPIVEEDSQDLPFWVGILAGLVGAAVLLALPIVAPVVEKFSTEDIIEAEDIEVKTTEEKAPKNEPKRDTVRALLEQAKKGQKQAGEEVIELLKASFKSGNVFGFVMSNSNSDKETANAIQHRQDTSALARLLTNREAYDAIYKRISK